MKLFKSRNIEFRLDVDDNILKVFFKNRLLGLEEASQFTGAIALVGAKKIYLDLREVESLSSDAREHLIEELNKQLSHHGVVKIALLTSDESNVGRFLDAIMSQIEQQNFEYKFFSDEMDALIWLKKRY